MTIEAWIQKSKVLLTEKLVTTALLDSEVLLADILKKDRSWLHSHPEYVLQRSDLRILDEQITRRALHEPLAYIRGKQEFYGRDFVVSKHTLTPRPETEIMVEIFLELTKSEALKESEKLQVLDIGTGSGCVIISASLELTQISNLKSQISYLGLDISILALEIAKKNAQKLNADVEFIHFDLIKDDLSSIIKYKSSNIILANLPYVPDNFDINTAATHEPPFAIFGGEDGLDFYRLLFSKLSVATKYVLTESLPLQHKDLALIAKDAGFALQTTQGFIQLYTK